MLIKPMVRNNIFLNAHPTGCALEVERQAARIESRRGGYAGLAGPRAVLVVGCSTGYGLASRIAAGFGFRAATVGLSLERAPTPTKTGSPGWYANRAFDKAAARAGLASRTIDADAYSDAAKAAAVAAARELGITFDLVVYSLASPVRVDPASGEMYRSAIKPLGGAYRGATVDVFSGALSEAEIGPADEAEAAATVKVMGGEDWALWIDALRDQGVLAEGAATVAYSYIGPRLSWPIYRDGTIGRAKAHLEATAKELGRGARDGLRAYVSINKALVTRSSAVIPIIPLYVSTLFKVMKERGSHEDCLDQMDRLMRERLYAGGTVPLDPEGRIRLDEREMEGSVQAEVEARMSRITPASLSGLADVAGFRDDFLRVHGFAVEGVDYAAEVAPDWDPAAQ